MLLRTLVVHSRRDTERFLAAVRALVYSVCCHPVALHCMNWHASLCFVSHPLYPLYPQEWKEKDEIADLFSAYVSKVCSAQG